MKKKIDFVTNSSSVSFIIATDKEDTSLKIKLEIEVDLRDYIVASCSTKQALKDYWLDDMHGDDEDEEYLNYQSLIDEGKTVHFLDCSDENETTETLLCYKGLNDIKFPDDVIVMQGQGGY